MVSAVRVLQVTDHLQAGGAERMVAGLVAALAAQRLAQTVVCTAQADRDADELTAIVRAAAVEHVVLGHRRQIDPRIVAALIALGRRHVVEVVHSHPGTLNPHAHLAARALGVPHVTTLHTMPGPLTDDTRIRLRADAWSGRRCTAVVAPAATVAAAFGPDWRLSAERTWIIPNAVFANPDDATTTSAPDRPESRHAASRTVLTTARLLRAKGLLDLVDAAATVVATRDDVRFLIAGDGPDREAIADAIDDRGLGDRVRLLGHRPDVRRLLSAATIFCLPSHHEGVPLSLLEAMSFGLPCVATAVGGIPDAVADGEDGVLIAAHDPGALAAALGRLLDDPAAAGRIGAAAAATARREHTADRAAERYAALYRTVAHGAAA